MATFDEIQNDVLRIIEDDVVEVTVAIEKHIRRAQRKIEELCAFRAQKEIVNTVDLLPTSSQPFSLPADFLGFIRDPYYYNTSGGIVSLTEVPNVKQLTNGGTDEGTPQYYDLDYDAATDLFSINISPVGDNLGPVTPNGAYNVEVEYWKRFSTLTNGTDTNYLTAHLDDALGWEAAAMVYAELRDPMANFWEAKAMSRVRKFVAAEKRNRLRSRDVQIFPSQPLGSRNTYSSRRIIRARIPS